MKLTQQSNATNHKRDQDQVVDSRRHRNKMSKLDKPPPSPDSSDDDDLDDLLSSVSDDVEIVISTTTNKFGIKSNRSLTKSALEPRLAKCPCDDHVDQYDQEDGDASTELCSETESPHEGHDSLNLSQLVANKTTTTTLSPSPSPSPFQAPPSPSISPMTATAIDSTTTTTTTTPTPPLRDLRVDARRDSVSRERRPITSKVTKQQLDHLDLLIDAIKRGNFNEFSQLMEKKREFKCNLLNVFVNGNTALHYSLMYGRSFKWCKQLILFGANPNLANLAGWHPIHLAASSCTPETLAYIINCVGN